MISREFLFSDVYRAINKTVRPQDRVVFVNEVDLSRLHALRRAAVPAEKPSYTALLARAIALTLREHPEFNRLPIRRGLFTQIYTLDSIDVTFAVEKDDHELITARYVETVRGAADKSATEITRELKKLSGDPESPRWTNFRRMALGTPFLARWLSRVPQYSLRLWREYQGGAAYISAPAKYGVDSVVGHWPWPLSFSFGFVRDRVMAVAGEARVVPSTLITFSLDTTVFAGAPAARFFHRICERMERAEV